MADLLICPEPCINLIPAILVDVTVSHKETIYRIMNKLRQLFWTSSPPIFHKIKIEMSSAHICWMDEVNARLEHSHQKSFGHLAQETGVPKSSAQIATKPLKLKPFQTIAVHELQPHDPTNRTHFCNWIHPSVHDSEIDPHPVFFSGKAWFHLHR